MKTSFCDPFTYPGAKVRPIYSSGRRKPGRPPRVHHYEAYCGLCKDDIRPRIGALPPLWTTKKRTQEIAEQHNREVHGFE